MGKLSQKRRKTILRIVGILIPLILFSGEAESHGDGAPSLQGKGVKHHQVTQEEVREMVWEYLVGHVPWEGRRVNIKRLSIGGKLPRLPQGFTYDVQTVQTSALLKRMPFTLLFKVDQKVYKRLVVNAEIEILVDVLLTSRPLGRFHVIDEEDLYFGQRDLVGLSGNILSDLSSAVGKRVKRPLRENTPLSLEMIEETPVIQKGDPILIVTESEGFRITAAGRALEKGFIGKRIQVMNTVSKKRLSARVIDSETVKREF